MELSCLLLNRLAYEIFYLDIDQCCIDLDLVYDIGQYQI